MSIKVGKFQTDLGHKKGAAKKLWENAGARNRRQSRNEKNIQI